MLKLWMVLYLAGVVVGSSGPLPYGMAECERKAAEELRTFDWSLFAEEGFDSDDVRISCEFHAEDPMPRRDRLDDPSAPSKT